MQKSSKGKESKMLTTVDILDILKDELGSDYRTAKILDMNTVRISQLRNKGGTFTDDQALKIAEILGVKPEAILYNVIAERSKQSPAFNLLSQLATKHTPKIYAAASVLAVAILATLPHSANFGLI